MTIEEAIIVLRNLQDWLYYSSMNGGTKIQREAIDIGIKALKQSEPCDDTISRQAAMDAIEFGITYAKAINKETGEVTSMFERENKALEDAVERVRQLPPAQSEIIRCKDCKHWIPYDWMFSEVWQSKNMADYPEDEIGCNYCDMAMKSNDFCSRGERREVTT